MSRPLPADGVPPAPAEDGLDRRRFLTYLVAAPTLAVAVRYGLAPTSAAAQVPLPTLPSLPTEPAPFFDLGDFLILAGKPYEGQLIVLVADEDGGVSCALPREEVGQGITTAVAMLLADELALPLELVRVGVADARPELFTNQLTGGSNTIRSVYEPVKAAAAEFRSRMGQTAAARWGIPVAGIVVREGAVVAPDGRRATFGELAAAAADTQLPSAVAEVPVQSEKIVGTPQNRIDARAMVTGRQKYTLDLDPVPGALPAMVRRPETLRGSVRRVVNEAEVRAMPGVVDVVVVELTRTALRETDVVESGVAVVAETFGQALDAKEALVVEWDDGPMAGESDETIRERLRGVQLPMAPATPLAQAVEGEFDFAFVSHAPLETNTAIADVRPDGADVWAGCKTPVVAQQTIADVLGLPEESVTLHNVQGGGSFGRRLFFDSALEAARISQAVGRPVKLLWTRVDDMRHGRARAASSHRVRFQHDGTQVLAFEQRVASVETDFRHGLGEIFSALYSQGNLPADVTPVSLGGSMSFAQSVFSLTVHSPYDWAVKDQKLNELSLPFNTGSWRSVYSANTRGAEEIMVDELAAALGQDPAEFRLAHLPDERQRAVLQKVLEIGRWGRNLPPHRAQGVAFHEEYRSLTACLVEIDVKDPLDPRVTRAAIAADVGKPINPRGLEAQLLGGLTDAIGTTLRYGLHLQDGLFLEGSYSQSHYPRQRDTPTDVTIHVFPETTGEPGGAGELGVPAAVGAIANAYARATGTRPRSFPIVFPVDFEPFPRGTGSTRVNPRTC